MSKITFHKKNPGLTIENVEELKELMIPQSVVEQNPYSEERVNLISEHVENDEAFIVMGPKNIVSALVSVDDNKKIRMFYYDEAKKDLVRLYIEDNDIIYTTYAEAYEVAYKKDDDEEDEEDEIPEEESYDEAGISENQQQTDENSDSDSKEDEDDEQNKIIGFVMIF
jgi:hypothetical protein